MRVKPIDLMLLLIILCANFLISATLYDEVHAVEKTLASYTALTTERLAQLSADVSLQMEDHLLLRNTELFKTIEKQANNQPGGKK